MASMLAPWKPRRAMTRPAASISAARVSAWRSARVRRFLCVEIDDSIQIDYPM